MCIPDPSGSCTNPLYKYGSATACSPDSGCSGLWSSWQVYDSEQFGYDYVDVWDAGQYHNKSGSANMIWAGCSPSWSTSYIGCGSDWWFTSYNLSTWCEKERIYGHSDGSITTAYYGPTYTTNPNTCT